MLQFGADVNRADHWGVTPMYLAATNAQLDVIRNLIHAGAELTYKNKAGFYIMFGKSFNSVKMCY